MVVFTCKMCGGNLNVEEGATIATCEYCGLTQTLPKSNDDIILNLYGRATYLFQKHEFDDAERAYENILNIDDTQAEAHWGKVLCKYGIVYVEEKDTFPRTKIPTCNRTQLQSILSDVDYLEAIRHADTIARDVYIEEAKKINTLQGKILEIVNTEEPYDVFICYKENDDTTKTITDDFEIARTIYYQLTNEGMKVFFANITLAEREEETEYEPYIYAALSTAKAMVILGTKLEYFNAIWVKNEWSRYVHLKKSDPGTTRSIIPCFRNLNPYDLPEEFSNIHALDMASPVFNQELIRHVKRAVEVREKTAGPAISFSPQISSLLKRAFMFLEDGYFRNADKPLETVLNMDPENSRAYVGKLMIATSTRKEEDLALLHIRLANEHFYQKALKFANDSERTKLSAYDKQTEQNILEDHYLHAKKLAEDEEYYSAFEAFNKIKDYKDSERNAKQAYANYIEERYMSGCKNALNRNYHAAIETFTKLDGYRNSGKLIDLCKKIESQIYEQESLRKQNDEIIIEQNVINTRKNKEYEENVDKIVRQIDTKIKDINKTINIWTEFGLDLFSGFIIVPIMAIIVMCIMGFGYDIGIEKSWPWGIGFGILATLILAAYNAIFIDDMITTLTCVGISVLFASIIVMCIAGFGFGVFVMHSLPWGVALGIVIGMILAKIQ